jgi:hypothetical protein
VDLDDVLRRAPAIAAAALVGPRPFLHSALVMAPIHDDADVALVAQWVPR